MGPNTCLELNKYYTATAYYSHYIPILISVILVVFTLTKSKFSFLARIFCYFIIGFCIWLIGDVITWTSPNYDLIASVWAPLDYINIIFYLFGAYFFIALVRGRDIALWQKIALFGLALPAWGIAVTNQSVTGFNLPVCEAFNSEFLTQYKLLVETAVVIFILVYALFQFWKGEKSMRKQLSIVAFALVLFFSVFGYSEYYASQYAVYWFNLYSLFVLPVFLFLIIYSITNLEIFQIRLIGSQLLAYVLIIMVGSQFFFLQNTTQKTLTVVTFVLSLGFGLLLVRSGKREETARKKVEKLAGELEEANSNLKELDRQKDELLGMVSHQLATPVTSMRWYLEMFEDGDMGTMPPEQIATIKKMQSIVQDLSDLVSMILDVSRIQLGRLKLEPRPLDIQEFVADIMSVIEPKAQERGVIFNKLIATNLPTTPLDKKYTRMAIENLLTNAVKYTPKGGEVRFTAEVRGSNLYFEVKDTGCGIPKEDQGKIFGKLFRASNVRNSIDGNGFGLYVAKGATENQNGKIWFESEEGKGTTFFVELPIVSQVAAPQEPAADGTKTSA